MFRNKKLGDIGEKIARKYLKRKKYKVLEKNFRYSKLGEIDIIAQKGNDIVFCEVKTRKKKRISSFMPEDNITYKKQRTLIKLAQIWLAKREIKDKNWQIDVIAIDFYGNKSFDIRYLENVIEDIK